MRLRHNLNERVFNLSRIKAITWASLKPNCIAMASKGVSSDQAIPMTLDSSSADSLECVLIEVRMRLLFGGRVTSKNHVKYNKASRTGSLHQALQQDV